MTVSWLDLLTLEVSARIARYITYIDRPSKLSLAQVSTIQRKAVKKSIEPPLRILFDDKVGHEEKQCEASPFEWAYIFFDTDDPVEIVTRDISFDVGIVLQRALVTRLTISQEAVVLDPLFHSRSLKCLTVSLTATISKGHDLHRLGYFCKKLFRCLRSLCVEQLHFKGEVSEGPWLEQFTEDCAAFARQPNFRILDWTKLEINSKQEGQAYWRAIERLPACTQVCVSSVPEMAVSALRRLNSVHVRGSAVGAAKLGHVVTRFVGYCDVASEILLLKTCPRVMNLQLELRVGELQLLSDLVAVCPLLRELVVECYSDDEVIAPEGTLLNVVNAALHLTVCDFSGFIYPVAEWCAALEVLGEKLETVRICLGVLSPDSEFVSQLEQLATLLPVLSRCNSRLRDVHFSTMDVPDMMDEQAAILDAKVMAMIERIRKLRPWVHLGGMLVG